MLYSKYRCNKFLNNNINFRVGTNGGVPATESSITVTASQALFPAVKFGDGDAAVISVSKTAAGVPATITKPGSTASDKVGFSDTVYIAGGTMLTDIGDISKFRPYELQLQNATGLKKLTIGSAEEGYTNSQLKSIDTSGCKILEELNIMGCTSLTGNIDLSKNGIIRKVFAGGSSASSITLPNGGVLEELHLGEVSDIEILNQTNLTTYDCSSYAKLSRLRVENTSSVPAMEIVAERLPYLTGGLRLVGIDETIDDTSVLEMLISDNAKGKYIDNNGVLSEDKTVYPYISGTIHCASIGSYLVNQLNAIYPYLTIDAGTVIEQFVVTFCNYDGTVLNKQFILRGEAAVDPVTTGLIDTPTRESTVSTTYTYDGWDGSFNRITNDTTVYATYIETTREYTVRWYNGSQLLKEVTALYGTGVEYDGDTPTNTSLDDNAIYHLFDGWDNNTSFVGGDIVATAKFTQATSPTDKTLAEMTPAELHALIKDGILDPTGMNNTIIASGDEFDLVMGKDYDFDNVDAEELIPLDSPRTFDGTNYLNTGIKLFADDKPFTLVIDYQFASHTDSPILVSCYEKNGFTLQSNGTNPVVKWGASSTLKVADANRREIVVIRRKFNDTNLYVYASAKMSDTIIESVINNTLTTQNEAPLSFGANVQSDGFVDSYAKGTVYWAKLWRSDLGETICRNLASWTRETITMKASGNAEHTFRLFRRTDNDRYVNCCFLMKELLDQTHTMNSSATNAGGWKESGMRRWLNARVYNGLPDQWKLLVQMVNVASSIGSQSYEISTATDYIWIPANKEVGFTTTTTPYSNEAEGTINYFTSNTSRIKKLNNGKGNANIWWVRSPNIASSYYFNNVITTGENYANYASYSSGVCFGFCI